MSNTPLSPQIRTVLRQAERQIKAIASHDHRQLYLLLYRAVCAIGKVDSFFVGLYSEEDGSVVFPYNYDIKDARLLDDPDRHFLTQGPSIHVIKTQSPYNSDEDGRKILNEGKNFGDMEAISSSAIFAPILEPITARKKRTLGVVSMQSYEAGCYGAEHLAALIKLASFASEVLVRERRETEEDRDKPMRPIVQIVDDLGLILKKIRSQIQELPPTLPCYRILQEEICEAQRIVSEIPNHPALSQINPLISLKPREVEVAVLLARGMTENEVADRLILSYHTIGTHRKNIYATLGIASKAELVRLLSPFSDSLDQYLP